MTAPPLEVPPAPEPGPGAGRRAWFLRELNILFLLLLLSGSAALLLSPRNDDELLGLPELSVGEQAPRTIKAPRDFAIEDPITTRALREEASRSVRPVYDLLVGQGRRAEERLGRGFALLRAEEGEPSREQLEGFMRALGVYFDEPDLQILRRAGFSESITDAVVMLVRALSERQLVLDKELLKLEAKDGFQLRVLQPDGTVSREDSVLDPADLLAIDEARPEVDHLIAERLPHLAAEEKRAVALLTKRILRPNVERNDDETRRRALAAGEAVKPVVIPLKRGELILRASERVTERHLLLLDGIAREVEGHHRFAFPTGNALLFLLLLVAAYQFVRRTRLVFLSTHRDLTFVATVCFLNLVFLWSGYKLATWLSELPSLGLSLERARYLLPVTAPVLFLRFVSGSRVTMGFIPVSAMLAGWTMDRSLEFALYSLVGALAGAAVPIGTQPRRRLWSAGFSAGLLQSLVVLALSFFHRGFELYETSLEAAAALVSGLMAAVVVFATVPIGEVLFGYASKLRLDMLANLNHPLLRELLVQAPGTYHHSIVVGSLAEAGAQVIEADPLLAKVGGYYHDIGKLKAPQLYEENQRGASGSLPPPEAHSTGLRAHVAEGLEIGARHRLGAPVLEILAQHHPTPSGPKPSSKEAGLVLLADAVEAAASREVSDRPVDPQALPRTIQRVVREIMAAGHLDACQLTLDEVRRVTEAFDVVLRSMLTRHRRPPSPSPSRIEDARVVFSSVPLEDKPN